MPGLPGMIQNVPPPQELALGEDQMLGREENVVRKQSKLCFIAFFVFILLFNLFEFQITVKGQH